jgi:hypothetical protein
VGLTDVAGVLSRKFVVGFFIPAFFACLALKLLVADEAVPSGLRDAGGGTQILIIGGVALLLGLLMWGVHYPLIRLLEGYWLIAPALPSRAPARPDPESRWTRSRVVGWVRNAVGRPGRIADRSRLAVGRRMQDRWIRTREHLVEIKKRPDPSEERTRAARELTARYPPESADVLPTELGNVIRAFENHPRTRYGLDGIPIWGNIYALLADTEVSELEEATTDVAFWLNSLVVVVVGGTLLFLERLWHPPADTLGTAAVEAAIAIAVVTTAAWMYRQLIGAAARWGEPVRAAFDMHRLELYDKLGVRRPVTREDDLAAGKAVNRLLMFGVALPPEWRAMPDGHTERDERWEGWV